MSPERVDDDAGIPQPRQTLALFGHVDAERTLLQGYRSGRIPHAWLIGGEPGIGKATLAYRMARFVLAHPAPAADEVQNATTLAVSEDHPVTRRIAVQGHSDLLELRRVINEKTDKLFTEIRVEDVRRSVSFFGSTAGQGGWRVAIVDSVEELNTAGINALLKVLEEPPSRALLLLVSHAPGRVIPTIRSRCRRLLLRPLSAGDVARAVAQAVGQDVDDTELRAAAEASEGSVNRALLLFEGETLQLRQQVIGLLERLPKIESGELHALGDELAGTDPETLAAFMDAVNAWLSAKLGNGAGDTHRVARIATAWQRVNSVARDAEEYNLDRRPLVFTVFGVLAEATR